MMRSRWLTLLLALAACAPKPLPTASVASPASDVCRIGPDGARPVADRGIGGTGAPATQVADRGIGGTGIIGVITGFASVCLAGQEVALPPDVPALIDGQPGRVDDLRAGQLVALEARGAPGALQASQIMVQHAVIGPVKSTGRGTMMVAGQFVFIADATGTATGAKIGDWVAVSGLQQTENTIVATRIDPAPPGRVLVRGELIGVYGALRIGTLRVRLMNGIFPPGGWPVIAVGHMDGDVLVVDQLARDTVAEGPSEYFGPAVSSFIVESYVAVVPGGYLVNRDFVAGSGFAGVGSRGRGIASFTRSNGGGLRATGLRLGNGADASGGGFTPAPVPRGGLSGGRGSGGGGRQNGGFGQRGNGQGGYRAGSSGGGSYGGGQEGSGFQGQAGPNRR
jgi:hypothetical protein